MGSCYSSGFTENQEINIQSGPSNEEATIIRIKYMRDDICEKKRQIYKSIDKSENEIKESLKKKNKERAKFALQRKKLYDEYLIIIENKYSFLEKMIFDVENAMINRQTNITLKETNKLLKDIQNSINLDDLEDAVYDLQKYDEKKKEFNKLFDQYNIGNEREIEEEYMEYEKSIFKDQKYVNNSNQNLGKTQNEKFSSYNQDQPKKQMYSLMEN